MNAAARLTYHLRRSDHITDALVFLHWLRVPERVQYKIAVLVYQILYRLAPAYFGPLNYVADLSGCRPVRSADTNGLAVSPVKFTTVVNQPDFFGPRTWNDLPDDVTFAQSLKLVIHLPSVTQNSPVHQVLFLTVSCTGLHLTCLIGPSSSLYYLSHFKIPD